MRNYSRITWIGAAAIAAIIALAAPAFCQSQDDSSQSVAEAARKAKERKKAAGKEGKVITEDELKLRPASADSSGAPPAGTVETTGATATPADASATKTDGSKPADADKKKASDEKEKAAQAAEVTKTKELLAEAQEALDLLKRKMALDSDSFYSNPDHARDADGKAKLDELQNSVLDKQTSVEDLKSKLAELMRKAGISPDADKSSTPPQQ